MDFLQSIWSKHSNVECARVGDEWFVVPSSWLKRWRDPKEHAGTIDSSCLSDHRGIKAGLIQGKDFELVDAFLWAQLTEIYGCKVSLSCKVQERGVQKFVEIRPPRVNLYVFERNEPVVLASSVDSSIVETWRQLKSRMIRLAKCQDKDIRMWYDFSGNDERCWSEFVENDEYKTLEDLNITSCDVPCVLIETRDENGKWRLGKHEEEKEEFMNQFPLMRSYSAHCKEWRDGLTKGSRVDFRCDDDGDDDDDKKNWREAIIVHTDQFDVHVHCLGWLEGSKYYKIRVSRDSTSLAPPHTKIRDWRKQLKKEARVDLHVKLFLNNTNAPYYRSLREDSLDTFTQQQQQQREEIYYIHYVKSPDKNDVGEWWLGSRFDEAHGHLYFQTDSLNPLELRARTQDDECWLYYNEHRGSFVKDPSAYIQQVSFQDALTYSSSANLIPDLSDNYPRFIRLAGHTGMQHLRCNNVYGRFVPTPDMGWVEARVKRVDHKTGRVNLHYVTENGTIGSVDNVDLYSEFLCLYGTHTKGKKRLETGYEDAFRSGPSEFGRGLVGLRNMGNTCYMNSMLQCLFASKPLVKYMLMKPNKMKSEINLKNALGTGGEVANAFQSLISVVWSGRASVVEPRDFKTCFGVHNNKFAEYMKQQDSMEMFSALMDNLHEDLNRVKKKPVTESVEDAGRPDDVVAKEAWDVYIQRNDSVIVDTFFGQDKSQLWCPDCEKIDKSRRKFDSRLAIHVNVPSESKTAMMSVYMFRAESTSLICVELLEEDQKGKDLVDAVSAQIKVPISRLFACEILLGKICKTLWNPINGISNDVNTKNDIRTICVYELGEKKKMDNLDEEEQKDTRVLIEIIAVFEEIVGFRRPFRFPFVTSCQSEPSHAETIRHVRDKLQFYKSDQVPEHKFNIDMKERTDTNKISAVASFSFSLEKFFKKTFRDSICLNGFATTTTTTNSASTKKRTLNEFYNSSTPKKRSKRVILTLMQCLESTFKKEQLGDKDTWFCPDCKNHVRAFKQMWIWSLKDTLVLHLKRFTQTMEGFSVRSEKKHTPIEIPIEIDMSPFVIGPQSGSSLMYELYAVSHHFGGAGGGHYTAQIKHSGKWYNCDDSYVTLCGDRGILEKIDPVSAYALFYRRRQCC